MYAVAWAGAFQRHNAGSASLPPSFSASHLDAAHCCSAPPPRTACRSIRLLCGSCARFLPLVTRCVVAAARRVNGTGGEGKRCLDVTVLVAIETATTEYKAEVEKALISTVYR